NTILVTTGASGIMSVSATNSCGAGPVQTISVMSEPKPTVSVVSGSICNGESFIIAPTGANTYSISGNNYTVTPNVSTNYLVLGTSTAGCVSDSTGVATVSVHPLP